MLWKLLLKMIHLSEIWTVIACFKRTLHPDLYGGEGWRRLSFNTPDSPMEYFFSGDNSEPMEDASCWHCHGTSEQCSAVSVARQLSLPSANVFHIHYVLFPMELVAYSSAVWQIRCAVKWNMTESRERLDPLQSNQQCLHFCGAIPKDREEN